MTKQTTKKVTLKKGEGSKGYIFSFLKRQRRIVNVVWLELPTQRAELPKTSEEFAHFARIQQGWLSFAVEITQYKKKTEFDLHGSFG